MAIFNVGFYLSVLAACIIISPPFIQGWSLRRRHGHHSHSSYYNLEESLPRDLSGRLEDDLERNSYGQTKTRGYPQILNRSSKYEDSEDRVPPYYRRYRHEYDRESLRPMELVARRKRHNKHDSVTCQNLSKTNEQNRNHQGSNDHGQKNSKRPIENGSFKELEVKEAQNRSVCKYTVETVPDIRGTRVPKDLEHVKCNHMQSPHCQGGYCCIQTYKNIEVSYGDGVKEKMRLYVGCVCAHDEISNNLQDPQLPVSD